MLLNLLIKKPILLSLMRCTVRKYVNGNSSIAEVEHGSKQLSTLQIFVINATPPFKPGKRTI